MTSVSWRFSAGKIVSVSTVVGGRQHESFIPLHNFHATLSSSSKLQRTVSLTSSTNCQRPLHGLQFFFIDKARMRTIADINLPLARSQMPYHILRPKAIPYCPNLLTPQL